MHFCYQHELRHFFWYRVAYTYTMALQDFVLQCGGIFFGDGCVSKYAEASINAVYCFILFYYLLHILLAGFYFFNSRFI